MTSTHDMYLELPFSTITNSKFKLLYDSNKPNSLQHPRKNLNYLTLSQINKISQTQNALSILMINSRSLNKNFIKLETLITQLNFTPTIIFVSETWIQPNKPLLYTLKGYSFHHSCGNNKSAGAGFFIKHNLNFKIINNYNLNVINCDEIWAELTIPGSKSIIFCSLYRHPEYQIDEFKNNLLKRIETLNNQNKQFIIGGDININLLNDNNFTTLYKNDIFSLGTQQLTQFPTRIQNNQKSLLDHFYTNIEENKFITKGLSYFISDHVPVITLLNTHTINKSQYKRKIIRDMKKFNFKNFSNELQQNLATLDLNSPDISGNSLWKNFNDILTTNFNKHAPLKIQSHKEHKKFMTPWITNGIIKSIKIKQKLYKKAITKTNILNWIRYKSYRNRITKLIQHSKQNYYKSEIIKSKSNPGKLWKTLNNIITIKKNINTSAEIKLYDIDNSLINDPEKVSSTFNQYFANIGPKLSEQIKSNSPNPVYQTINKHIIKDSFFLPPFTINEIKTYIKNLNPNKSTPKHSVPTKVIKMGSEILSPVITKNFNICIEQGVFPDQLKAAEIRPIYKNKGDKFQANNWRPISILSPFSKLYEYHIHSHLTKFFNNNNILHQFQYEFRANSSTEMAIT